MRKTIDRIANLYWDMTATPPPLWLATTLVCLGAICLLAYHVTVVHGRMYAPHHIEATLKGP